MSSEDIDSTTTTIPNYLNGANGDTSDNSEAVADATDASPFSPVQQKRKLSENEAECGEDSNSSESSKKPRTDEAHAAGTNGHDVPGPSRTEATGGDGGGDGDSGEATSAQEAEPYAGVVVKQEPPDDTAPGQSDRAAADASSSNVEVKVKVEPGQEAVKVEPAQEAVKVKPAQEAVKVKPDEVAVKAEASSSARESCRFGITCYRDDNDHDDGDDDDSSAQITPVLPRQQWTSNSIRKMLQMVEERPVIWQVDFSDRTSRPNAFLEIEAEIGIPALEIKRKLHNMRCTFRTQYRTAQLHNRPVKWRFFDDMKFMYSSAMSSDGDPWDDEIGPKSATDVPWKKRIRLESRSKKHAKNNLTNAVITPPPEPSPDSNATMLAEDIQVMKTEYINHTYQIRDDCHLFGDYVADSLRYLPDDLREIAKKQIKNVLCDIATHASSTLECNQNVLVNETVKMTMVPSTDVRYEIYAETVLNEPHEIQLGLDQF